MKNTKMGEHALCAKAIKQELKKAYPLIKFSVKSDTFAGGNSVGINWTNGPTVSQVELISKKYEYGHFNGMEDIYEINNRRNDIPQAKYIHTSRNIDPSFFEELFKHLQKNYMYFDTVKDLDETSEVLMKNWNVWNARNYCSRIFYKLDLTNGINDLGLNFGKAF